MERIEIPPFGRKTRGGGPLLLSAVQAGITLIAKNDTGLAKGGFKGLRYEESLVPNSEIRVSSKQTKIIFGSNRNKPKQDLFAFVSVCFVKPITKSFGLFRCFEPISKQLKQTELFHKKPKQTETTLNFLKNTQIYSL